LGEALAALPSAVIDTLMPHDLVFPKVMGVKSAKTVDEVRSALLVRSRLGKLVQK
jgi:hypothetical protein